MPVKVTIKQDKYLWRMFKEKILKYLKEHKDSYIMGAYGNFYICNKSDGSKDVFIDVYKAFSWLSLKKYINVEITMQGEIFKEHEYYLQKVFARISDEYNVPVHINYEVR